MTTSVLDASISGAAEFSAFFPYLAMAAWWHHKFMGADGGCGCRGEEEHGHAELFGSYWRAIIRHV
jgi:hypothetical protein